MGIFTEVVETSFKWTRAGLFEPFTLKKWLLLAFVAFMAGSISGSGFNFNIPYGNHEPAAISQKAQVAAAPHVAPPSAQPKTSLRSFVRQAVSSGFNTIKKYLWMVYAGVALVVAIGLLMLWLACRFTFIFLENVLTNSASIKAPFSALRKHGNALFRFQLVLGAAQLCALCLAVAGGIWFFFRLGAFDVPRHVSILTLVLAGLSCAFILVALICVMGVLQFVMNNFMVPLMYKDACGSWRAWVEAWALLRRHPGAAVKYFFLRIAMVLLVNIGYGIIVLTVIFVLALLGVGVGLAGVALYRGLPASWHALIWGSLVVVGVPVACALWYGLVCLYLPCAFFLRTMSMAFIARLEPGFEMFTLALPQKENTV